jgi:beclin
MLPLLLSTDIILFHRIDGDKVGSHTIVLSFNKNENWTKALKYMLCNLKWVLYWFIGNTSFAPPAGSLHKQSSTNKS